MNAGVVGIFSIALWALSAAALTSAQDQSANDSAKEAEAFLAKAIEAHGLKGKLPRLRTARITSSWKGDLPGLGAFEIKVKDTFQLPQYYRKDVNGSALGRDFSLRWAIDGKECWSQLATGQVVDVQVKRLADGQNHLYKTFERLAEPAGQGRELKSLGKRRLDELDMVGVRIGSNEETATTCHFEAKSGLLRKTKQFKPLDFGPQKNQWVAAEYDGYREFDGMKLPTKITSFVDGKKMIEIVVEEAKFPDNIDKREFARP